YCGLSQALSVQKGDTLVSGDLIGTIGNTADIESSLTPHLHIEMLHNGSYIDPISEIR
nr:M23 family metallopeptidase [Ruminococcus sp.]